MENYKKMEKENAKKNRICETNEKHMNKIKDENKELYNNLMKLKSELSTEENKLKDYTLKEDEKSVLNLIVNILDKNGLIDNILSTSVMPKLMSDVNELLGHVADYKVDIQYTKGKFKIVKIQNNSVINIDTLSGCERFIANIAFKLALDGYNNYIKTKFIIIDEVFTCCDDNNIAKLPSLFNYIKNQYKFALVISHDDRIKKLYNSYIEVTRKDNQSKIKY
jgi:DNA repair exonuclease SbcCD ATPase subunit